MTHTVFSSKWNALGVRGLLKMGRAAIKTTTPSPRSARIDRRRKRPSAAKGHPTQGAFRARRKFLRIFPGGFRDEDYVDLERSYKWNAHLAWQAALNKESFAKLLAGGEFEQIAAKAVRIESRTNLLFSFEKMALRDAVKSSAGAKAFAVALWHLLHGPGPLEGSFSGWVEAIGQLPRRQTRVLTWPLATVFGFIAQPDTHFFLKPMVTREAARRYGHPLPYSSRPTWSVYSDLLRFVRCVRGDILDLRPRDMIDMQSFLWVQGSDEYPG